MAIVTSMLNKLSNIADLYTAISNNKEGIIDNIGVIIKIVNSLSYEDVVAYFTLERPSDPKVSKMLLKFQKNSKYYIVTFLFLGEDEFPVRNKNGILYGRQMKVLEIDKELSDLQADYQNGIIFQ